MTALALPQPYLLFLGDTREPGFAKTAFGLRGWAANKCVSEFSSAADAVTTGLPRLTPAEAVTCGAELGRRTPRSILRRTRSATGCSITSGVAQN